MSAKFDAAIYFRRVKPGDALATLGTEQRAVPPARGQFGQGRCAMTAHTEISAPLLKHFARVQETLRQPDELYLDTDAAAPVFDAAEACRLAINLARNCGHAVFPCSSNKTPTRPKCDGGDGYKDATTDPERITELWRRWPGPLIGVATGKRSGISVVDVDIKHDPACAFWRQHEMRFPTTRTYRTRGGGFHLVFLHAWGVRNVEGKPVKGLDVRGEGGYVIHWFAAGCECLDPSPPAAWPHWLTPFFWPPEPKQTASRSDNSSGNSTSAIDGLIRVVRDAQEGTRNGKLNWAAYHMRRHVNAKEIEEAEAKRRLMDATSICGLPKIEAERTIKSAWSATP